MTSTLPVVERFHSLQGEGSHVGRSAFFIRLASCTVGCSWCDTKDSWSADRHPKESINQLSMDAETARANGAVFVVITGGEPLHHNLDSLCHRIRERTTTNGRQPIAIHLETSGVNELSGSPNWITLSPKRHAPPRKELLISCQELKVIIHEKDDLKFAEYMASETTRKNRVLNSKYHSKENNLYQPLLFLQPGWDSREGESLAFEYVKYNPQWRLSMQTHKWLKVQ